jgi:hypothetical protein
MINLILLKVAKKTAVYAALFLLLFFSCACTNPSKPVNNQNHDIIPETNGTYSKVEQNSIYNYEQVYDYKPVSKQDMDKLKELVSCLQYARELPVSRLVYEDDSTLRIDYALNLKPGQSYHVNHQMIMADTVILLAILDDLNAVEFNFTQADYGYGGVPITIEKAGQVLGADIKSLGKDKVTFLSVMPQKIIDLKWDPDVMDVITYEHIMS